MDSNFDSHLQNEISHNELDTRCAPGRKFADGSCINIDVLIEMAKAHNTENPAKLIKLYDNFETLNPSKYKKYLLHCFKKLYNNVCNTQQCWTEQAFIKKMDKFKKAELLDGTFRPDGPEGRFEWLNTYNINDVMEQYEKIYPDFKFLGAVPIDFDDLEYLKIKDLDYKGFFNKGIKKIGVIFNLDESYKSGSHWVACYTNLQDGQVYYFDSYGMAPEPRIRKYMRRCAKACSEICGRNIDASHNKIRHQYEGSECGVYSINFILRLLKGEKFDEICQNKIPDKHINKCRKVYFNNPTF